MEGDWPNLLLNSLSRAELKFNPAVAQVNNSWVSCETRTLRHLRKRLFFCLSFDLERDEIVSFFFFQAHEDPMYELIRENKRNEKETRYTASSF